MGNHSLKEELISAYKIPSIVRSEGMDLLDNKVIKELIMIQRFARYITKCRQVGFAQAVRSLHIRYVQRDFDAKWRNKAKAKQANHSWQDVVNQLNIQESFSDFLSHLNKKFDAFPADQFHLSYKDELIIQKAEQAKNNIFDLLGSGPVRVESWHEDFRLYAQGGVHGSIQFAFGKSLTTSAAHFDATSYFKDIKITAGTTKELGKDIKLPWELSRCQHFIFLGKAYQLTKDESYVVTFTRQVTDWIDSNPFLLGVNWVCPMEVALRAINWIWAFYFFKDASIAPEIWQKFVCSLYDHIVFLENNWELYDGRTSNHYLSDLVGYLYLCYFFSGFSVKKFIDPAHPELVEGYERQMINKKARTCSVRIVEEMQRQVFAEGTSYEGSTQYHRLVTELFYHASIHMQACDLSVPIWYSERLQKMCSFIDWCSPADGLLVSIGDHDSGSVLYGGLSQNIIKQYKKSDTDTIKHYNQFGLSIMKAKDWHITLRHHAYNKKQPSGHFHNDVGSITLAYKGTPILIDPGSFVYTASAYWRNYFRSVRAHNTFFLKDEEPVPFGDHLFGLDLPENDPYPFILHARRSLGEVGSERSKSKDILRARSFGLSQDKLRLSEVGSEGIRGTVLSTQYSLHSRYSLQAQRIIQYDDVAQVVTITDSWQQQYPLQDKTSVWNFTFAPGLTLCKDGVQWVVCKNGTPMVAISSTDLEFNELQGWASTSYGVKEQCIMLRASTPIIGEQRYTISINF